jgi:hypothetical protein
MSLENTLATLEELKDILDLYDSIKYESTEETKAYSNKIPQLYGAVEKIYKSCANSQPIEIKDSRMTNTYANFFEAGYLSGRTFHKYQGYQELLKVIGCIRSQVEQGITEDYYITSKQGVQLPVPEKLTISWLMKHVEIKHWFIVLAILGAVFSAGLWVGKSDIYEVYQNTGKNIVK